MGVTSFSTVRKATKLAVYDEMKMREKYHQDVAATRPDNDFGTKLIDCRINDEKEKKRALEMPKLCTAFAFE